jgi:predicted N-acetyltransferase YhbS
MKFLSYKKVDRLEIERLFKNVFSEAESNEEGDLIAGLVSDLIYKTADEDIFGYVANSKSELIGAVFFTRMTLRDNTLTTFILSPMAVSINHQGQGIGQKLINHSLTSLKESGVQFVFTYGDPNFYSRVGFQQISEETVQPPFDLTYPEGWLCQSLGDDFISGISDKSRCVDALNKPEYW